MMKTLQILFLWIMVLSHGFAQSPRIKFLKDSVVIGDPFKVSLVFDHSPDDEVIFPKKIKYFTPFELHNIASFQTVTVDTVSKDSLVYTLELYKTDPFQILSLPVWILNGRDSIEYQSNQDTIHLKSLVSYQDIEGSGLKSTVDYFVEKSRQPMRKWQKILIGIVALIGFIALIFRKKIENLILRFRFQKRHQVFRFEFKKIMFYETDKTSLQQANSLWRSHMEWLEKKPFTSYSASEIADLIEEDNVGQALREVESSLFGNQKTERIPVALQILFSYANDRFKSQFRNYKKQLKNG
ncbi:MAG: hypothetical protein NXI00_01165 [Cytophagales bacterium]|nr:hypothetical protein [Cytophagales bacterium]